MWQLNLLEHCDAVEYLKTLQASLMNLAPEEQQAVHQSTLKTEILSRFCRPDGRYVSVFILRILSVGDVVGLLEREHSKPDKIRNAECSI